MDSIPLATASSTEYWMRGLSTSGSISFGEAFVAGRNRVPNPAAGKTALRILFAIALLLNSRYRQHSEQKISLNFVQAVVRCFCRLVQILV
jgi:hypothetical protein